MKRKHIPSYISIFHSINSFLINLLDNRKRHSGKYDFHFLFECKKCLFLWFQSMIIDIWHVRYVATSMISLSIYFTTYSVVRSRNIQFLQLSNNIQINKHRSDIIIKIHFCCCFFDFISFFFRYTMCVLFSIACSDFVSTFI